MKSTLKKRKLNFCKFRGFFANGASLPRNGPKHKLTSLNKLKLVTPPIESDFSVYGLVFAKNLMKGMHHLKELGHSIATGGTFDSRHEYVLPCIILFINDRIVK